MKAFFVKLAIKALVGYLASKLNLDQLLREVKNAENFYDKAFSKKGHVYRYVKSVEGENFSTSATNLLVELGVYLVKRDL